MQHMILAYKQGETDKIFREIQDKLKKNFKGKQNVLQRKKSIFKGILEPSGKIVEDDGKVF